VVITYGSVVVFDDTALEPVVDEDAIVVTDEEFEEVAVAVVACCP
jgi:hypothetical protein